MGRCTRAICTDKVINTCTIATTVTGAITYVAYGIYATTATKAGEAFRSYCPSNSTLVPTPLGSYSCSFLGNVVDSQNVLLPLGSWTVPLLTFAAGAFAMYKFCTFIDSRRYVQVPTSSSDDTY